MGSDTIDFGYLEGYVGGDPAIIREVLTLFSDQARTALPALDPSAPFDRWRRAAHVLKGSALGIGAEALAQACGEAEMATGDTAAAKAAARDRIAACLDRALSDIALYMSR